MRVWISFLFATLLFAREHTVKLEPFEIYHIKASVAGAIVRADESKEGAMVKNAVIVKIDDVLDRQNLQTLNKKLTSIQKIIAITKDQIKNAEQILNIAKDNYERIKGLSSKSKFEKDAKRSAYLNAKASLLTLKEKLQNLSIQKEDLLFAIKRVEDALQKKNPKITGYIYKVYPKEGDFVAMGAPLVDVADISKAKVILYLDEEEIDGIEKKHIYINGKRSEYRFSKIIKIPDSQRVTEYRVELTLPAPKLFGKFITVEIK